MLSSSSDDEEEEEENMGDMKPNPGGGAGGGGGGDLPQEYWQVQNSLRENYRFLIQIWIQGVRYQPKPKKPSALKTQIFFTKNPLDFYFYFTKFHGDSVKNESKKPKK